MTVMLLADGLYLAIAMYATGGTSSPLRFLVYLHLVAVTLLASYRTGLKIALWQSLLLLVFLYAQAAGLLPPVDVQAGATVTADALPVVNLTAYWVFALATSLFSAMNERELRQRRRRPRGAGGDGRPPRRRGRPDPPGQRRARRARRPLRVPARPRPGRDRRRADRPRRPTASPASRPSRPFDDRPGP